MQSLRPYQAVQVETIERKLYESIRRTGIYSTVKLHHPMKNRKIQGVLIRRLAICGWRISFVNGGRKIEVG